ncbi:MAG: tetratricopeptide repeat protein, partial [Chitinophagaceae bacterium]
LEEHPYNELAWFNLGAAYQGLKLYEKAVDAYLYAVAINEKFDYAYRNMGDAYIRLRNYKDAIDVLEKVLELTRPEAVIYEAIGHCYDKQENFAQARFNYKKASHLSPEEGNLHFKIASTYMNEGNWKTAIKNLDNAIKLNKLQPEYNLAKGRCYLELGNVEEAITQFGHVVRMRPRNINGWVELLKTFHSAGMYEDGLEYAGFAWEQTEGKPIFRYYISMFLLETGKTKEGLIQLESAIQASPKQIKKFIEINPSILQHPQVVDLVARYKKKK